MQEREREVRARNIHGFKEAENNNEAKEEDNSTIKELLNILELEVIPEYITRLGISNRTKPRPIRLKFKTLSEKEMIMSSLPKLKTACERFKKISITEDYTFNERQAIKQKAVEAKQKTDAEGDGKYIWKVKRDPKKRASINTVQYDRECKSTKLKNNDNTNESKTIKKQGNGLITISYTNADVLTKEKL